MGNIEKAPIPSCNQVFLEDAPLISNGHLPTSKLNHLATMGFVPRIQRGVLQILPHSFTPLIRTGNDPVHLSNTFYKRLKRVSILWLFSCLEAGVSFLVDGLLLIR
jgi:hypothetical protein